MKNVLLIAGFLAAAISPAFAADDMSVDDKAKMMTEYFYPKMDKNSDGKVTKAEHDAAGTIMFMKADANKDGAVSKDEMMAMKKEELTDMMNSSKSMSK